MTPPLDDEQERRHRGSSLLLSAQGNSERRVRGAIARHGRSDTERRRCRRYRWARSGRGRDALLVRAGTGIDSPGELAAKRIGAIAGSTNMTLAEQFEGAELVPFGGESDDVFGEMIDALRVGEVHGVVDDDVAFLALAEDPDFEIAFTVPTRNQWGVAVSKARPEMRDELDGALSEVIEDGRLAKCWESWLPGLAYPFGDR